MGSQPAYLYRHPKPRQTVEVAPQSDSVHADSLRVAEESRGRPVPLTTGDTWENNGGRFWIEHQPDRAQGYWKIHDMAGRLSSKLRPGTWDADELRGYLRDTGARRV